MHKKRGARRLHGGHSSPFKGRGMEYNQSRQYAPGDDIRNMDWRVTARTGRPYTKLFHEEKERPVCIGVDFRPAMFFATRGRYKAVVASQCASLLAWGAQQHGDRVGGLIFSERSHHECKPERGRTAVLRFIGQLVDHPAWEARPAEGPAAHDTLERAFQRLLRVVHPGSLVLLISDFRQWNETCRRHLMTLSRHNELLLILVYDPLEASLPEAGRYRLQDRNRDVDIDVGNRAVRTRYAKRFAARRDAVNRIARSATIHALECRTIDEPAQCLQAALATTAR